MKNLYCSKCGTVVIKIEKGKVLPNLYIKCHKCNEKERKETEERMKDMPEGFDMLFGGKK